jgi:geranylgeranyl diphosphate synthase type I
MLLTADQQTPWPTTDPLAAFELARDLVGPALRAHVERLAPSVVGVAGYHAGWLDEHGDSVASTSGKALRPTIAVLAAQALGVPEQDAVRAGAAVELIHDFSLLHDDVIDGDRVRRHRPTAWVVFGVPAAILAGDGLLAAALQLLTETGGAGGAQAVQRLLATVQELIRGQTDDVAFEVRKSITPAEYLSMAGGKTAALLACAASLGPLLGEAPAEAVGELTAFGEHLGMAFQLTDDLLGIWGDPTSTGKPVLTDLYRRKKSAPVIAALTAGTPEAEVLADLYSQPGQLDDAQAQEAVALIELCGGRQWTEARTEHHTELALKHLDRVGGSPEPVAALAAVARFVTRRDH